MLDIGNQLTEDVCRLDVSMNYQLVVNELEGSGDATQNVEVVGLSLVLSPWPIPELVQGALTELHDEVAVRGTDLDVVELDNVLVLELDLDEALLDHDVVAILDFLSVDFLEQKKDSFELRALEMELDDSTKTVTIFSMFLNTNQGKKGD